MTRRAKKQQKLCLAALYRRLMYFSLLSRSVVALFQRVRCCMTLLTLDALLPQFQVSDGTAVLLTKDAHIVEIELEILQLAGDAVFLA
jgi:hypothetical protein